jgi:ABC transporter related
MKYLKFNSVKVAVLVTILYSLTQVIAMNSLALLKVNDKGELIRGIITIIILNLLTQLFLYLRESTKSTAIYYIYRNYHKIADKHYLDLGIDVNNKESIGEKTALYVNDIPRIVDLTFKRLFNMLGYIVLIIFILISLFKINFMVGILGIIMIFSLFAVSHILQPGLTRAVSDSQEINKKYLSGLTELFRAFSLMIELNIKNRFMKNSEGESGEYSEKATNIDRYAGKISALLNFISQLFTVLILGGISYFIIEKKVSVGLLVSALSMVTALGDAATLFYADRAFLKSGKKLYADKLGSMDEHYYKEFVKPYFFINHRTTSETPVLESITPINNIRIKNLSVKLGHNTISFPDTIFQNGKKYAVVGKSGSGKSTLLKVMLGHIKEYSGSIYINGEEKSKEEKLYDRVAYVSQESFVFNNSVDDNLKLVDENVDTENIMKELGLQSLTKDYILGENGANISGGQKQRIAIARAILRGKNVFFLDEITSNLDPDSKKLIEEIVLSKDAMIIWVTHDLNSNNRYKFDYVVEL